LILLIVLVLLLGGGLHMDNDSLFCDDAMQRG
jgi:hypothetical protein